MTTTHPDPHTCPARGVELRTAEEIEAERQHYRMRCEALWPGWMLVPAEATEAMVKAYLDANDAYWRRADELPKAIGKWRKGSANEATAEGYRSMLAVAPASPA